MLILDVKIDKKFTQPFLLLSLSHDDLLLKLIIDVQGLALCQYTHWQKSWENVNIFVKMGEWFIHFDKNILILRNFGTKSRLFSKFSYDICQCIHISRYGPKIIKCVIWLLIKTKKIAPTALGSCMNHFVRRNGGNR